MQIVVSQIAIFKGLNGKSKSPGCSYVSPCGNFEQRTHDPPKLPPPPPQKHIEGVTARRLNSIRFSRQLRLFFFCFLNKLERFVIPFVYYSFWDIKWRMRVPQ